MGSKDRFGMVQMAEPPEPLPPRPLEFPRRPRVEDTELAKLWTWKSRCGRWVVVHRKPHYGLPVALGAPDTWLVLRLVTIDHYGNVAQTVSRHRTKREAFEAAQQQAAETPIPNPGAKP